jgi:hypothetical protein
MLYIAAVSFKRGLLNSGSDESLLAIPRFLREDQTDDGSTIP